ncbi:MAG: 50S ribosomal protein L29 [Candidatus Levybacteria bacterium]|nr:50S ribosomal protein L29 [Candidatus Levybacteria bacterium]
MKTKDKKDLHTKTVEELRAILKEAKAALSLIKLEKTQLMLKNTSSYARKRKEVAQIGTILREKELTKK